MLDVDLSDLELLTQGKEKVVISNDVSDLTASGVLASILNLSKSDKRP
eukprot:CAMPEP_0204838486 /NCGR_PEP_ID=MMETSP1346-20131115/31163_1 /ASSEMBLY_ACC=CAM_ASM_000771 /TAXON_ID=215587 /ORGANISM="Aplanochytrium stocchinoi, Strain GSBS06" /LENGTH=47 /DNA_ID= /DNA_START= /DNA_END= /DNA_ORIENTATION=